MKNFIFIAFLFIFSTCQKEEFFLETDPRESSFLNDGQLTNLVTSIALHDGSFDDAVDGSNCFSINFPYEITLDNSVHNITGKDDLSIFQSGQEIRPVFPIQITFSNHEQIQLEDYQALLDLQHNCAEGLMDNNFISCVDFVYNIDVALFDSSLGTFSSITFDHDRTTYQSIQGFSKSTLASLQFPVILKLHGSSDVSVHSNEELKEIILEHQSACN